MPRLTQSALARLIDHTLLKPEATSGEIEQLCREALQFQFASVCVQPNRVSLAFQILNNSPVRVCTVVGFPLGANSSEVKAFETEQAIRSGATEIDMVIHLGALREGNDSAVEADIRAVVQAARGNLVKVILETCLLTDEEIARACRLSVAAGAGFVKTSTGFSKGGATPEAVALMRRTVGDKIGVKASGGIRDLATLEQMVAAGANRIGTSSGVSLMQNQEGRGAY